MTNSSMVCHETNHQNSNEENCHQTDKQTLKTFKERINWGVSLQFFGDHTDIFRFHSCPIAIKFSPAIDYGLKFVKI